MSTPTLPSDDLEARLRSAFADRADEVRLADLDPDLPSGIRISLDDDAPRERGRSATSRAAWLSIAAALLVVVAALGLGAAVRDDGEQTTTAGDPEPPATAPRAEVFSSFPEGVDPAKGEPIFVTSVRTGPPMVPTVDPNVMERFESEEAMAETLAPLGEVTEPMPTDLDLGSETWESFYAPLGEADPTVFGSAADPNERGGVVVARPGPGGGRGVVAVTSQVIDMTGLVREGDQLSGIVRASVPARVLLTVFRARTDGQALTDDDLILWTEAGPDGSDETVLPVGKVADAPVEVGDGPIVVSVEVGSAPRPIGEPGVGVAALAAVGIPGAGGPGPDDTAASATTTAPLSTTVTTVTGSLPVPSDWEPMWQPPLGTDVATPWDVAGAFVEEVLGEDPTSVEPPRGTAPQGPPPTTGAIDPDGLDPTPIEVLMPSGRTLTVVVAHDGSGWVVIQVGDGGVEVDTSGPGTSMSGAPPGSTGDESNLWVALRRDPGTGGWSVERGRLPDPPSLEDIDAVVAAVVDDAGRVVAANGNAL